MCWLLFSGATLVYVAVSQGTQYAYDGRSMLAVTRNLVDHGTLRTTGAFSDSFHMSTPYSPYGIGMSLLGVPSYALSKVVGHAPYLFSLVNPMVTSAAVIVTFLVARELGWKATEGLMAALAFGFASMALPYTTEYFSEPAVTLCLLLMVLGIVRWREGRRFAPLLVGIAAGGAAQFRTDSIFTVWVGLLVLPVFVPFDRLRKLSSLVQVGLPIALGTAAVVAYNEVRYSRLFVSSYGGSFTTPISVGLHGLLLSAGKSLFVFNPLALLGVVGLGVLFFRDRPFAFLITFLTIPRLLFFARWSAWQGGWSWGPRFLLPVVPLLTLAAIEPLRATLRVTLLGMLTRVSAAALALAGVAVNLLAVRVPYQQWLQVLATPRGRASLNIHGVTWTSALQVSIQDPARGPI